MRTNVCGREGVCEEDEEGADRESRCKYLWWRECMQKGRAGGVIKCVWWRGWTHDLGGREEVANPCRKGGHMRGRRGGGQMLVAERVDT